MLHRPFVPQLTVPAGVCCQTVGSGYHSIIVAVLAVDSIEGVGCSAEVHTLTSLDDCRQAHTGDNHQKERAARTGVEQCL